MPNPIVHFEVLGKDKAILEDFYRAAFDWQLNPAMDNYSTVSPGAGINGGIGTSMDGGSGHATFYVEVANIPETLAVVEGRGGRKLTEPEQIPNGPLIALFADPDGHVIGLVQAGTMRNG
jgi:predicted enzyme related to lactoylglutathione lyase